MPDPGKRALVVSNWFSVGADRYAGYTPQLVAKLRERDWSVTTASSQPHRPARLADMVCTAWRRRGQYAVALVDVFSGPAFLWAEATCWVLRRAGKPYVLTLHGGALPAFARRWPGRVRRLLGSAAAVTTPSRYLQEQMAAYREGIRLLPNAIDLSAYPPRPQPAPVRPLLVWLRAFHRIYNPVLAAQVVERLRGEWPQVRLTMVGPDKGDGSLGEFQRFVAAHRLAPHVTWAGAVPKAQVTAWLRRGDIFLNTTSLESFGVSVMEAAAAGLCIVTTDVGELSYLWRDGDEALLVPPGDAEAMAAAVRRLLAEPGLAARLSQNARRKAEGFDWAAVLPQWEELLWSMAV